MQITREKAKQNLATGQKPDGDFFADFIDSLVFKSDDLRSLFLSYASQLEAEQGLENTKVMTALRVQNALDKLKAQLLGVSAPENGNDFSKIHKRLSAVEVMLVGSNNNNNRIDRWKEITAFLNGISDRNQTLLQMLNNVTASQIGDYKYSAQANNHEGWLLCNGAAISRTTYAELFQLINTKFGAGDGTNTFNLPDARGRVLIQSGTGSGLSARNIGDKLGSENKSISVAEMPSHSHKIRGHNHHYHSVALGGIKAQLNDRSPNVDRAVSSENHRNYTSWQGDVNTENTGNGRAFPLFQPSLVAGNLFIYSAVKS